MADTEEYFPRGGKKPTVPRFKQTNNVSTYLLPNIGVKFRHVNFS